MEHIFVGDGRLRTSRSRRRWLFASVLAACAAACSGSTDDRGSSDPATRSISQELNAAPKLTDFVFYASNSIDHQAFLTTDGDIGVRAPASGPTLVPGFELGLGRLTNATHVDGTHAVIAPRIQLNFLSTVGDVQGALTNGGGFFQGVFPFPAAMPTMPLAAPVAPGSGNLTVTGVATLNPGSWNNVTVTPGSTLILNAGLYQINSLTVGAHAHVRGSGSAGVELRIKGRLAMGFSSEIEPALFRDADKFRIEVNGMNGSAGGLAETPAAAFIENASEVEALVFVPNGTLDIGSGSKLKGAFTARDINVRSLVTATHKKGFPVCAGSCDDGNPCTTDGCGTGGSCLHIPLTGTSCNDGDDCTGPDACETGVCRGPTTACINNDLIPTVNCVVQLDSNTFGAVFGYSNAVGGAVTLGVGPRNSFSGGQSDLGQPILFVPGQVPTATFQTFPTGAQLTWTLGQHSAVASASSPACSTPLATALVQLFTPTNDSRAVQQLTQNLLSNPRFPAYMAAVRARFTSLSPFQSALLDAMDLLIANADLVADPATLSPAQLARLANLRAQLLSNPAVVRLRLAGDAMRAQPQALQCDAVSVINRNQPLQPLVPAQSGSLYSSALALANSPALHNVQTTLAGVLTGDQSSAVLAASGLLLSATLSEADLLALELPGPILTSLFGNILSVIGGAVAGALIGAAGGPVGAIGGAIAGGTAAHFAYNDSGECAPCNVDCEACAGECCIDGQPLGIDAQFLTGDSCGSSGTPCLADTDCGPDALCAQFCCMGILDLCPGNHCSSDADCSGLNTCQIGCCAGPCGQRGTTCNVVVASACGVSTTGCSGNETCERGCCSVEPPH